MSFVDSALGGLPFAAGQRQKTKAKEAARAGQAEQEKAQLAATARAAAELRRQDRDRRRINKRTPDLGSLLSSERQASRSGPGATTLTGAGGIASQRLTLGRSSLLGVT